SRLNRPFRYLNRLLQLLNQLLKFIRTHRLNIETELPKLCHPLQLINHPPQLLSEVLRLSRTIGPCVIHLVETRSDNSRRNSDTAKSASHWRNHRHKL